MKLLNRVRLCDPMDCRLLGSSVHGIFQARVLEWGAIAFSDIYTHTHTHTHTYTHTHAHTYVCVCIVLSCFSHVRLLATPWTAAFQAPPSMGFSRQEYWSGMPLPSLRYADDTTLLPLVEKAMATHSSTLAWKIPWTEEPSRLESMGLQRVRHD